MGEGRGDYKTVGGGGGEGDYKMVGGGGGEGGLQNGRGWGRGVRVKLFQVIPVISPDLKRKYFSVRGGGGGGCLCG